MRFPRLLPALLPLLLSCSPERPQPLPRQPWVDQPPAQWPPVLLTNQIRLGAMEFTDRGNGFLIAVSAPGGTLRFAVTNKHLFLAFQNSDIQSIDFAGQLRSWTLTARGSRADSVIVGRLLNADPAEKIVKQYIINRDWLLFSLVADDSGIRALIPRYDRISQGEQVYLIGWTEEEGQQMLAGSVDESYQYKYLVDFAGQDVAPFSGAPVIDADGYLIGIHTGVLGADSWVNSTQYLKEILAQQEQP